MKQNNHTGTVIEYLKVSMIYHSFALTDSDSDVDQADIEGAEWSTGGFSDWFATGVLTNVNQLAMELHVRQNSQFSTLLGILQQLYNLGFRVISQEVNMVVGPDGKGYYNLMEVVFMKTTG